MEKRGGDAVTIVGGRPMHRAVEVSQLPIAIEQLLTLAALDHAFRERVLADPVAAANTRGLRLSGAEAALLRGAGRPTLEDMIGRVIVPRGMSRRDFMKPVAASIVALIAGKAILLCAGCTGLDSTYRSDEGAREDWIQLAGHLCYAYQPARAGSAGRPLLLALHGEGETCLSNVSRWRTAADRHQFDLVSVNWTEEPATAEARQELANDLQRIADDWARQHPVSEQYLCSRGTATPLLWRGGFEQGSGRWRAAVFLGGIPDGDWIGAPDAAGQRMVEVPPALRYVVGDADPEYAGAVSFFAWFHDTKGRPGYLQQVAGETGGAALDFSSLFEWMASQ